MVSVRNFSRMINIRGYAVVPSAAMFAFIWLATVAAAQDRYVIADGREVAPLDIFQECAECPEMIMLPMGKFTMGAQLEESRLLARFYPKPKAGEPDFFTHEGPPHEVLIDQPIAMGRTEVTNEEWMACVHEGGCRHAPDSTVIRGFETFIVDGPRQPVIDVSFYDVLEYVAWLNTKVGSKVYRPPTEAEWEYAARSGTSTKFAQGDTLTNEQANFTEYQSLGNRRVPNRDRLGVPISVDRLDAANAWGLRHMSGNVFEWTMSCLSKRPLLMSCWPRMKRLATLSSRVAPSREARNMPGQHSEGGVGKIWGSGCGSTVTAGQPAIENGRPHDCYAMGTFG